MMKKHGRIFYLLGLLLFLTIYYLPSLFQGWIPHDEGALAHPAARVLQGEIPHVDFDDLYTGGLSFLNALSFKLWGTTLASLRIFLFAFFLAFAATTFVIAKTFVKPWMAVVLALVCAAWSVPNYFAAMPSWYILFFSVFGIAALIRFIETDRKSWLFLAGALGGLAFLIKVVAVYYLIAGGLFLLYREQQRFIAKAPKQSRGPLIAKTFGLLPVTVFLFLLLRQHLDVPHAYHFLLPGLLLCAFLIWSETRFGLGTLSARLRSYFTLLLPFLTGAFLIIGLYLVPYLIKGQLGAFFRGVFILPSARLDTVTFALPPLLTAITAIPYALALLFALILKRRKPAIIFAIGTIPIFVLPTALGFIPLFYQLEWFALRALTPLITAIVCLVLIVQAKRPDPADRERLFLLICMTVFLSLIQYPYGFAVYFYFFAPLLILTIAQLTRFGSINNQKLHVALIFSSLVFALLWLNRGYVHFTGVRFAHVAQESYLLPGRGDLFVTQESNASYTEMARLVAEVSDGHEYIYAFPECHEVYFLTGKKNPTRSLNSVFDDPNGRNESFMRLIDDKGINTLVINRAPEHLIEIDKELYHLLAPKFPNSAFAGKFEIRWKK